MTLLAEHGNTVPVTFSPDGSMPASGSWDDTFKLWRWSIAYVYQESPGTPEYRINEEAFVSEINATPLAPAWEFYTQHGPAALKVYKEQGMEAAEIFAQHGPAALKVYKEQGMETAELFVQHGPEALEYYKEYGLEAAELFVQHGPEALAYYKEHGLEAARLNAGFNLTIAP
ncbi:MAG: hypothetical protein B6D68_00330, partial [spirochete symbiont of Stewartia floridana]